MKYLKKAIKCPFCPDTPSAHDYKTFEGISRHVWKWHVLNSRKKHPWEVENKESVDSIRIYISKFSKYYDISVTGEAHVDAIIESISKGEFNPSLR